MQIANLKADRWMTGTLFVVAGIGDPGQREQKFELIVSSILPKT